MTDISLDPGAQQNIVEYTVGEISQAVKRTLEGAFEHVRVRGEVGRPNYHTSGHLYFTLKDSEAALDAVCWRGTVGRLGLRLEEGMEVVCTGRISSYPRSSRYQIVIESVELAGEGALLKILEDRRRKLAAEGLFDDERKQRLPFLPGIIGVVTSPTGAVIRDILHRLADRFPRHVVLWPVPVQGEGAAEKIAAAITGFNALGPGDPAPRPDLLIVARGGGSLEDLWAFNEEVVVRAAADSAIPLISAVGHETDTTLIDHAADVRAPTPSAAAEMAVPVRAELLTQVLDGERRMITSLGRLLDERRVRLDGLARGLPEPQRLLETANQRLDSETDRLRNALAGLLGERAATVARLGAELRHPREAIALAGQSLDQLGLRLGHGIETAMSAARLRFAGLDVETRLPASVARLVRDASQRLAASDQLLDSLSYQRVLERGYAVVRDAGGAPVTRARDAVPGADVVIGFADGEAGARFHDAPESGRQSGRREGKPGRKRGARKSPPGDDQGRLL